MRNVNNALKDWTKAAKFPARIRRYILAAAACWTLISLLSLWWNRHLEREEALEMTRKLRAMTGVTMSSEEILDEKGEHLAGVTLGHGAFWFLGLFLIAMGGRRLGRGTVELEESEARFRSLVENSLVGTYIIRDGKFAYANPKMAEIFGYAQEEIVPLKSPMDLTSERDRPRVAENVRKRIEGEAQSIHYEFQGLRKDGTPIEVEVYGTVTEHEGRPAIIGTLLDVTERKQLEEQLRHSQKLEAVGQLAGGVAHDFNNILTAIIGYGSLMEMRMKTDDPLRGNVGQLLAAAERAAHLTHSLLAFSRKQVTDPRPVNLDLVIENIRGLLARLIGEEIELEAVPAGEELIVTADCGQMEQVLINLAVNARDAMPEGGRLTIETGRMEMGEEFIRKYGYGRPGSFAVISVGDTGTGMDEAVRSKIFDPFFTTKEVGKGSGLGLSIVYGIVKQHDGYVNCESEPGKGTTFRIYLPLTGGGGIKNSLRTPNSAIRI